MVYSLQYGAVEGNGKEKTGCQAEGICEGLNRKRKKTETVF